MTELKADLLVCSLHSPDDYEKLMSNNDKGKVETTESGSDTDEGGKKIVVDLVSIKKSSVSTRKKEKNDKPSVVSVRVQCTALICNVTSIPSYDGRHDNRCINFSNL